MNRFKSFFLKPASPTPLAALRIGVSTILLLQAISIKDTIFDFLSSNGILQGDIARYLSDDYSPQISWFTEHLASWHVAEATVIQSFCGLYILSLICLLLGLFTRTASILAWFLNWMLISTAQSTSYGVDLYSHVTLFYLMWIPAGDAWSLDVVLGRRQNRPSTEARLGLRLLQLHLCITYFSSGIEKAEGIQWWNGELMWRALTLPEYRQFNLDWIASWPILAKLGGWATLILEIGYTFFIWPQRTRKFWVLAITLMHLGIALFLGLGSFGLLMSVLTLTLFGISAEPESNMACIVLFDGVCNLCNSFVRFTIKRDPNAQIRFASLQSEAGQKLLNELGIPASQQLRSIIFIDGRDWFVKSDAVLKLSQHLSGFWPLLAVSAALPRKIRDLAYDWIAHNRYSWFGKNETCWLPSPELSKRFLTD